MSRLRRLGWVDSEYPQYFVTTCTHRRAPLLANPGTHAAFRIFCETARDRGVLVGRYVLMPDHLHLFACIPPGEATLSGWMKSLKNTLSKHWRDDGVLAPHWQKGFFDHLLRSYESKADKSIYMRDNPVRAGLCQDAKDWPYAGEILPFTYE